MSLVRLVLGAALLLLSPVARAAPSDEIPASLRGPWEADSTTALGITGNITITQSEIVFQNGTRLALSYMGKRSGLSLIDSSLVSAVFRMRDPRDVRLRGTNMLCGEIPRYMALDIQGSNAMGTMLDLSVITGKTSPLEQFDRNRICATYGYAPGKPAHGKNKHR